MQLSDRTTGLGLAGLGLFAFIGASRLPPMAGQEIGPSVFPSVIGAGLVLCGVLIALGIGRSFEDEAEADLAAHGTPAVDAQSHPLAGLKAAIPLGALLFYYLAVDLIGFVPVAAIVVLAVAFGLGAGVQLAAPLAVLAPPLVHLIFAKLLRVPLPPGLLPMPW